MKKIKTFEEYSKMDKLRLYSIEDKLSSRSNMIKHNIIQYDII